MKEKLRIALQVLCLIAAIAMMMSFAPTSVSAGAEEEILPTNEGCTLSCRRFGDVECAQPDRFRICS